jgi:5-(carboxyamino)imidazole ribonucleotide synthase
MAQRIGIIGGGQLAWMMASPAAKLGLELVVQTPAETDPAVRVATATVLAAIDDAQATATLARFCDVITFENEFVNLEALKQLPNLCFRPQLAALAPLLDKYHQRCYLRGLNLPTPEFAPIEDSSQIDRFPIVLKTRRHGYDGYGTFIVHTQAEFEAARTKLHDRPLLIEAFVPFERELAVIAARSVTGEIAVYPIVETQQEQQICQRVFAPALISPAVQQAAETIARTLLDRLDAVGVFGIELFLTPDGSVLVNEIAPRVHNSGHFTIDACITSQFEQHLRAVAGLPLGDPAMHYPAAVMVNLLGFEDSESDYADIRAKLATLPNAHVHWYGKTQSHPGRKLGHVTVLSDRPEDSAAIAQAIEAIWYGI